MEDLPVELIANIFSYLDGFAAITASQVCSYFKLVATQQIRTIHIKITSEMSVEIHQIENALREFQALRNLKLEVSFDVNNIEKSKFCNCFCDELTTLILRDMTFLNPFFEDPNISFSNLTSLAIENSDLSSCSSQISHFILRCCPKLKKLTISGCSGLEIESLNFLGRNLNQTCIEDFNFLPTYCYFDVSHSPSNQQWTIENLKTLSVRSKLVVMRKNFVRNLIGKRNHNLKTLELVAELDLGENLVTRIVQNYKNLEKLSLGKGCSLMSNDDFSSLCNFYSKLKTLEFHFSQSDHVLDLKNLQANNSIIDLTIGLTKNITMENIRTIGKQLPKVMRLNIILYYLSTSNQEFLTLITKAFPNVLYLEFQRVGMSETMKFTAMKDEIDSPNYRNIDEIKNLAN